MDETLIDPIVIDSVTRLGPEARGRVVVGGSHAGIYAAYVAARAGVAGVVLNDAGIGLERAGIAGLPYLDRFEIPAAGVAHSSARIGDGPDCLARGIVSATNACASALGVREGMACAEAARRLAAARVSNVAVPDERESRGILPVEPGRAPVVLLDSVSLVEPGDAQSILVTGSHGGLLGGRPETAVKYPVLAAFYNDANFGIDAAGVTRLPALDARAIAGLTVAAASARIGDGASTYATGIVSRVNEIARRAGCAAGMSAREAVATLQTYFASKGKPE